MKEVLNISLQGISFAIESDALKALEQYLDELRIHYGEGEEEVVNDIEERIAELLVERGCKSVVVQYRHIEEIIGILGRPSEIGGDEAVREGGKMKKRVFRDTANGIVAGVCSGLGAYWNMDAVWVRILFFVVSFFITAPVFSIGKAILRIDIGWAGFMLVAYCVMWIIIPPARTITQRCQMKGEPQDVDHIYKQFAQGAKNVGSEMWYTGTKVTGSFFSALWRVICFIVGVLLTAMGFGGIVLLGVCLLGVDIAMGVSLLQVPDFIELNIGSTLWLKIFGVLTFLLPCVGMLYGGLQLCFRFKSPAWRPGLAIFLLWLLSSLIFIVCSVRASSPYYDMGDAHMEKLSFGRQMDTIYVECPKVPGMEKARLNMEASSRKLLIFYSKNAKRGEAGFALYPRLVIRKSQDIAVPYIESSIVSPYWEESGPGDIAVLQDSLVRLYPEVYSKKKKFSGMMPTIKLYVHTDVTVILKDPINHTFGERSYRCGFFN